MIGVTVVFDKRRFANLLKEAIGDRTTPKYADLTGVNRTYISKLLNEKLSSPPSPKIIKRLASDAYNNLLYEDLMDAAGYLDHQETIQRMGRINRNESRNSKINISQR